MVELVAWTNTGEGPFYVPGAPDKGDGLGASMVDPSYTGDLLKLEINVRDQTDAYVYGSTIEMWHCDENGVYDMEGYKYRAVWHTAGIHAGIDVVTALPGIATYQGKQIYRHVHLRIKPPASAQVAAEFPYILNFTGEIELMLPPWTDDPDKIESQDDKRNIIRLAGPEIGGFGTQKWYLAKATVILVREG
jgi:hypothetical protein